MFPESNEVENEVANEVPQQLGLKKQIKKIGSLVLFSYLLPELWSLNYQNVPFLQFFSNASKKSKVVIAIYVYASESSFFALLENGIG